MHNKVPLVSPWGTPLGQTFGPEHAGVASSEAGNPVYYRPVKLAIVFAGMLGPTSIPMKADWTSPDAKISAFLSSFGRNGIPLNVVYGPGAPAGILLPELLTQDAVLKAIDKASGKSTSSTLDPETRQRDGT